MNIADMREKCKGFLKNIPRDALMIGILVFSASLSFWLGYLAGLDACAFQNSLERSSVTIK